MVEIPCREILGIDARLRPHPRIGAGHVPHAVVPVLVGALAKGCFQPVEGGVDLGGLTAPIVVRRAAPGEKLVTLGRGGKLAIVTKGPTPYDGDAAVRLAALTSKPSRPRSSRHSACG